MSDLEIIPEDQDAADISCHEAFFDSIEQPEQRRYLCLDMARMAGALPEKIVPIAAEMEKFLLGKRLKAVE